MAEQNAWVTLATNDAYCLGALVLAHSLQKVGTKHPIVIMVTPSVTPIMRERLASVFAQVVTVDVLDSKDAAHLALLARPELGITFTKLHCWNLEQYKKCVFLDADTLVFQNCDELFEKEELSAAPDVGWPDCFNSGVFVFRPSKETFDSLVKFAQEKGSFDGGDQGLLNQYFSDWSRGDINKHLPFLYNVCSTAFYSYLPALQQYGRDMKIMHFIGNVKPWLQKFNWSSKTVADDSFLQAPLQYWWDLFIDFVHPKLDVAMARWECGASNEARYFSPQSDQSPFPWHRPPVPTFQEPSPTVPQAADFYDPWESYAPAPVDSPTPPSSHSESATVDCTDSPPINQTTPWYENTLTLLTNEEDEEEEDEICSINTLNNSSECNYFECKATPNDWQQQDCLPGEANGCVNTKFEEVRPRHPYDNYYLNHTTVMDQNGCKRCSHEELPHDPSPSPTPSVDTEPDLQAGIAGALSQLTIGEEPQSGSGVEEHLRRQGWEAGHIDYMGADSFNNIWAKISQTLNNVPKAAPAEETEQIVEQVQCDLSEVSSELSAPSEVATTVSTESKEEIPTEAPAVTEPQAVKEEQQDSKQEDTPPPTHQPEVKCPVKPERLVCHLKPTEEVEALLTPENEHEDAASIASSIIASEALTSPVITSPSPSVVSPDCSILIQNLKDLNIDTKIPDTPPAPIDAPVSLAQIGIIPSKCPEPEAICPIKADNECCLIKSIKTEEPVEKTELKEPVIKKEEPTATPAPKTKRGSKKGQPPVSVKEAAPACPIIAKTEVEEAPICPMPTTPEAICPMPTTTPEAIPTKIEAIEAPVCPIPAKTEAEAVCLKPTKPKKTPAEKKEAVIETPVCPMPDKTVEESVCPIPAKTEVVEAPVCPIPAKTEVEAVCPKPTKPKKTPAEKKEAVIETPVCPMPDKIVEEPVCPIPAKTEVVEAPVCPIPAKAEVEAVCPKPTKPKKTPAEKKEAVIETPVCPMSDKTVEEPVCPIPAKMELVDAPVGPIPTKTETVCPKPTKSKKKEAVIEAPVCPIKTVEEAPVCPIPTKPKKAPVEKKETAVEAPVCPIKAEEPVCTFSVQEAAVETPFCPIKRAEPTLCTFPVKEAVVETPVCPIPTKPKKTHKKEAVEAQVCTIAKDVTEVCPIPIKAVEEVKSETTEKKEVVEVEKKEVVEAGEVTAEPIAKPKKVVKKTPKPKLEQSGSVEEVKKSEEMPVPPPRKKEKKPKEKK